MLFVPFLNTINVRLIFSQGGKTYTNNIYYEGDAAWSVGDIDSLLQDIETLWASVGDLCVSSSTFLIELQGRDMTTQFGTIRVRNPVATIPGTITGDLLPINVAACVALRSGFAGRSYRGRIYVGGLSETQVVGNTIQAAYVTALLTYANQLRLLNTVNNCRLVVASKYFAGLPRVTGLTTIVNSVTVNSRVDTQRRRLPK